MKETNRLRELIFIKPQSLEEAERNWKEAQVILQSQTQDIKKKIGEMRVKECSKHVDVDIPKATDETLVEITGCIECVRGGDVYNSILSDILEAIK